MTGYTHLTFDDYDDYDITSCPTNDNPFDYRRFSFVNVFMFLVILLLVMYLLHKFVFDEGNAHVRMKDVSTRFTDVKGIDGTMNELQQVVRFFLHKFHNFYYMSLFEQEINISSGCALFEGCNEIQSNWCSSTTRCAIVWIAR
jgi:hypothetical protein